MPTVSSVGAERLPSVGWALLVVILTVPYSLESDAYPHAQVGLAALAALSCLAALPGLQDSDSVFSLDRYHHVAVRNHGAARCPACGSAVDDGAVVVG